MIKVFLLALSFVLYSCEEQVIEQIENQETAQANSSQESDSFLNADGTCRPFSFQKKSCTNQKSNALLANINRVCNSEGSETNNSPCVVESCLPGFVIFNNECRPSQCSPNSSQVNDCSSEISNAQNAYKTLTCDTKGSDFSEGECILSQCRAGYYRSGNVCRPLICVPNTNEKISCINSIPNSSKANINRSCNPSGTQFIDTQCILESCQVGHVQSNGKCEEQICIASSTSTESCSQYIANASDAKRNVNCNFNGTYESKGICTLLSCQSGYNKSGNTCVPQTCSPNQLTQINCSGEISNASMAQKAQTCNSTGTSASYGSCLLQTCRTGFNKVGNSCIKQACTPGQVSKISCTANIPNSSSASIARTCNITGTSESDGSCILDLCVAGYSKDGNSCKPLSCTPNASRIVSCSNEIPDSSKANKTMTCSSDGKKETASSCTLNACNNGFKPSGNECIKEIEAPNPIPNPTPTPTPLPEAGSKNTIELNNQWINIGDHDKRNLLKITYDGSQRAWADVGQSCKDWLISRGVNMAKVQVGSSIDYRDGDRINYFGNKAQGKFNAIPNHYQNYKSDNFTTNTCPYRFKYKTGVIVCERANIGDTHATVKARLAARYSVTNPDVRAVAHCEATSGAANALGRRHHIMNLHLKFETLPSKQSIILDDRFLTTVGNQNEVRGKKNESALEFLTRIGVPVKTNENLFVRRTYTDLHHLLMYRHAVTKTPLSINDWYSVTNKTQYKSCLYESSTADESRTPSCSMRACTTKSTTLRPVLKCLYHFTDPLKNNEPSILYEVGMIDQDLSMDPGFTLNSPERAYAIGINKRNGPDGASTSEWLDSVGLKYGKISTFKEHEYAYYTHEIIEELNWYKRGLKIPFPINYHRFDVVQDNVCPYEIINKSNDDLFQCEMRSCTQKPSVSSRLDPGVGPDTHLMRPVTTCTVRSNWSDQSYNRAFFKHSIHLSDIGKESNTPAPIPAPEPEPEPTPVPEVPSEFDTVKLNNEWINIGKQVNRKQLNIIYNGGQRAWADAGQSCKTWLQAQGVNLNYAQVGTSVDYKDADRMHFNGEKAAGKYNAVANHYENFRSDNFTTNVCPYRFRHSTGIIVCERASINDSYETVKSKLAARYSVTDPDVRAVAHCEATSNSEHAKGRRHHIMNLHVKYETAPTKQTVILDDRLLTTVGNQNEVRGKKNESALEFFSRIGLPTFSATDLFVKRTYSDLHHLFMYRFEHSKSELSINDWYSVTNTSVDGVCLYEQASASESRTPSCTVKTCNSKGETLRPVLKCMYHFADILKNNETSIKFEQGVRDNTLSLDPGLTLNSPEKALSVGITNRNGPEGKSTSEWLDSLNIKYGSIHTFKEFENAYYTHEIIEELNWYKRGLNIPFPINYHRFDVVQDNVCPYEIIEKATNDLFQCEMNSCSQRPVVSSRLDGNITATTHFMRPVTTCTIQSNWSDQSYKRGFFKHSIQLYKTPGGS